MRRFGRLAASLAILGLLARALDVDVVMGRLASLSAEWVAFALCVSVTQGLVLAWRWRFTAARLGIDLPYGSAVAEYYLGNFLNQVLPGGIVGDVSRAWRHARTDAPTGTAVRAVVLERLSSQVVMTTVAVVSLVSLPGLTPAVRGLGIVALGVVLGVTAYAGRLVEDARVAVLDAQALPFQVATAVFVVATYIVIYLIGARAVGDPTPAVVLAPLVAPVLMTMLLPVSVAGWGVREAAAAGLWALVGLTPEDGVAISVTYGLLVLVSTLPGAVILVMSLGRGRSRTGRRRRGGSDGPAAGSHRSDSGSDRA